jgi:carbon-monoxide dehydrogenase medium subunit
MKKITYLAPESIEEAVSMHTTHGDKACYIAGGTDVMVKLKEGWITPDYIISLKRLSPLRRLELDPETGRLHIGSLVTHRILENDDLIKQQYSILHDAVVNIGSVQVRNVATIGGNLVTSVPSADGAVPLIAMDASATYTGIEGEKTVDLIKFFTGPGENILKPGQILKEITVPPLMPNTSSAYVKFGRRAAMELPLIGIGLLISMDENLKTCRKARICLGVAAPTPMRAFKAEAFLEGKTIDEETLKEAGRIAGDESKVRDSYRGVAWHRREMINVFVKRIGLTCLNRLHKQRAGG